MPLGGGICCWLRSFRSPPWTVVNGRGFLMVNGDGRGAELCEDHQDPLRPFGPPPPTLAPLAGEETLAWFSPGRGRGHSSLSSRKRQQSKAVVPADRRLFVLRCDLSPIASCARGEGCRRAKSAGRRSVGRQEITVPTIPSAAASRRGTRQPRSDRRSRRARSQKQGWYESHRPW